MSAITLENNGLLNISSGTLNLASGAIFNQFAAGVVQTQEYGRLSFNGSTSSINGIFSATFSHTSGTTTFLPSQNFSFPVRIDGGTVIFTENVISSSSLSISNGIVRMFRNANLTSTTLASSTLQLNSTSIFNAFNSLNMTGNATITTQGSPGGIINILSGCSVFASANATLDATLMNYGYMNLSFGLGMLMSGSLVNTASGFINFTSTQDADIRIGALGKLTNVGFIDINLVRSSKTCSNIQARALIVSSPLINQNTIRVLSGSISIRNTFSQTIGLFIYLSHNRRWCFSVQFSSTDCYQYRCYSKSSSRSVNFLQPSNIVTSD